MREGGDLGLGKGKIDEMGENGKADGGRSGAGSARNQAGMSSKPMGKHDEDGQGGKSNCNQ